MSHLSDPPQIFLEHGAFLLSKYKQVLSWLFPPPKPKRKKQNPYEPFHWLHEIFFIKMDRQHFHLGLIPHLKMKVLIIGYDS
jgi:hypothetical protein